jgi:hypothetical protein
MFCRLLFVLLYLLFWPFCCMFFFDIQILITLWYLQTLIKVQRSMFDGNDFRYYANMPLHCLSSFHCIVCHPSIVSTERNQRLKIVRGMAIDLPSLFLTDQKFIILQVLSLWVILLPVLLFHIAMIISTCYLENGIKVKDHSRPWPLTHRLLSHKHGNTLGTQICFLLTEKIRWFIKRQYANGRVK